MTKEADIRKISVEEYYRMAETKILRAEEHVELINGLIYPMSPQNSNHAFFCQELHQLFQEALGDRAIVRNQLPIRLSRYSEPEPDIAVCKPQHEKYRHAHPGPGEIYLIIEVADSSLEKDMSIKSQLYARSGIPEYWIIEAATEQVHLYSKPEGDDYQNQRIVNRPQHLNSGALGLSIDCTGLWEKP